MTIMYGPYRHRRHVRAFDHASIAVNNRAGILRDSLHILYFARKSPQTAGPSPMDSPDIKEQMLQIKIKVRSIWILYAFYNHLSKSAKIAGPSPMYSPEIKQQIL